MVFFSVYFSLTNAPGWWFFYNNENPEKEPVLFGMIAVEGAAAAFPVGEKQNAYCIGAEKNV